MLGLPLEQLCLGACRCYQLESTSASWNCASLSAGSDTSQLTSPDDAKEQFYEKFDQVIRSTPSSDKLVILGDFNVRVGRDYSSWEGVLGRHGVGKTNDNGLHPLSKCAEHSLCITNTWFRMADKYKTTWIYPRSKHWHLIDFIIVRQRDVRVTRAMRGTECWTDHRLVKGCASPAHCTAPRIRSKTVRAAYNVTRLKDPSYRARFRQVLAENLQDCVTAEGSTEKWTSFKVSKTAKEVLGVKARTHEDWFDKNDEKIKEAIHAKNKSYIEWLNDPFSVSKRERFKALLAKVKTDLRAMQDQWWRDKVAEVQSISERRRCSPTCTILKKNLHPTIIIDDKPPANVEHFKYLGSIIYWDGSLDREIDTRINKASQVLGCLRNRVLSEHNIRLSTKLKVYNAVVLPSLLYGCETWTL